MKEARDFQSFIKKSGFEILGHLHSMYHNVLYNVEHIRR